MTPSMDVLAIIEQRSLERCCNRWARIEADDVPRRWLASVDERCEPAGARLVDDRCEAATSGARPRKEGGTSARCEFTGTSARKEGGTSAGADSMTAEQRRPGAGVSIRCWTTLSLSAVSL